MSCPHSTRHDASVATCSLCAKVSVVRIERVRLDDEAIIDAMASGPNRAARRESLIPLRTRQARKARATAPKCTPSRPTLTLDAGELTVNDVMCALGGVSRQRVSQLNEVLKPMRRGRRVVYTQAAVDAYLRTAN